MYKTRYTKFYLLLLFYISTLILRLYNFTNTVALPVVNVFLLRDLAEQSVLLRSEIFSIKN